uniref:Uncharacterized protein n=1 Tax=Cacopsylla melanoneura TaxID=428564 RepID=A0A8D8ZW55_9HEMI
MYPIFYHLLFSFNTNSLIQTCSFLSLSSPPLPFLPSMMFFRNSLCLMRCPVSLTFLVTINFSKFLFSLISISTCWFVFMSVHFVLFTLLQIHISIASNFFFSILSKSLDKFLSRL